MLLLGFFFSVSYLVLGLRWIILCNFTFFFFSMPCLCSGVEMSYFVIHWTRFKIWLWILLDVIWLFMVEDSLFIVCHWIDKRKFWFGMPDGYPKSDWVRFHLYLIMFKLDSSKKIDFGYGYCKTRSMSTSCYP